MYYVYYIIMLYHISCWVALHFKNCSTPGNVKYIHDFSLALSSLASAAVCFQRCLGREATCAQPFGISRPGTQLVVQVSLPRMDFFEEHPELLCSVLLLHDAVNVHLAI